jgi:putative membrane-bound dehydrogenase-like protein
MSHAFSRHLRVVAAWIAPLWMAMRLFAAGEAPGVPPGWRLDLIASAPAVEHPSVVCTAPDGRLFVAEDPMDIRTVRADGANGRILCRHADGRWTTFADHLHAVFGMQYLEGRLYVLHNPQFSVFTDDNGVGRDRFELIESMNPNPWALDWNDHVPANFKLGMDGYFYLATGDKGIYGATGRDGKRVDLPGGGILRLRPDGTELEVWCTGVRNILDVALTDEDEVFTYDNTDEHDWMGRLTHMIDGGFYGYPHEFSPRRPYTLWMMHDFGGGAACGTLAYTDDALPAGYSNNLFLADFGKREVLRVRLRRDGGTWAVDGHEEFFTHPPDDFRPVGLAWTADGAGFYVCDWQHRDTKEDVSVGRLWRAVWTNGPAPTPRPSWYEAAAMGKTVSVESADLLRALEHPAKSVRLVAQRLLGRRGASEIPGLAGVLADNSKPERARWHALWALDAIDGGAAARREILRAAGSGPPGLRRQALRQIGGRALREGVDVALAGLDDADASVRVAAASALGRIGDARAATPLVEASGDGDLFGRYSIFTALNRIGRRAPEAWSEIAAGLSHTNERVRESARFALRETYEPALVTVLAGVASGSAGSHHGRAAAAELLAASRFRPAPWAGEWGAYHPALEPAPPRTNDWAGSVAVVGALERLANDDNPVIRRAVVEGLTGEGDAGRHQGWLRGRFIRERHPEVLAALIDAAARTHDNLAAGAIAQAVSKSGNDERVFDAVMRAAPALRDPTLNQTLLGVVTRGAAEGQAVRILDALGAVRGGLAATNLLRFTNDGRRNVRFAAWRALAAAGGPAAVEAFEHTLAKGEPEERRAILGAMGRSGDKAYVPLLLAQVAATDRTAALSALVELRDARAIDAWIDGLDERDDDLRAKCRRALQAFPEEARVKAEARVEKLPPGVVVELRRLFASDAKARSGPLFAGAAAPSERKDYADYAERHHGDPVSGQRVFFDAARVGCIRCHTVAGAGTAVGPDLTLIGAQYPRRDLVEHVLDPSKVVREGYQQWTVETGDGESYSGLIRSETAGQLTLIGGDGKPVTLDKGQVTRRTASALSLMPEGLQNAMSLDEFADLVAYLESRREDPRRAVLSTPVAGYEPLFDGRDLEGWGEAPTGTQRVDAVGIGRLRPPEHWKAVDGLLEHDGVNGDLWTTREFGDFELLFEWRWADAPVWADFPLIGSDALEVVDSTGKPVTRRVLDCGDSGVFLRGLYKAQANLFCYPVGSGEFWEYRTDLRLPSELRRALTPKLAADRPVGDWNEMRIALRGRRVSVRLNGREVIADAELPGLPDRGPIGLQHEHGRIQFRNLFVRPGAAGGS